jgi:hypothetical protein
MTFEQFQALLIGSDEYYVSPQKGKGSPAGFVAAMFHDVLGRDVDAQGQSYFSGLLAGGTPRPMVVGAVVYSTEHLASTVNGYYQHFLHRDADGGGLAYWVGQLRAGARDELIVGLIVGSDEYFARSSTTTTTTTTTTSSTTTTTTKPKLLPDLVITSVAADPATPQSGQPTQFTAIVRNQGSGATPAGVPIGVAFAVDGPQVTWATFQAGGLASGASIPITTSGTTTGGAWATTAGNHTLTASVDQNPPGSPPVNRIAESNETNNKLAAPLGVPVTCDSKLTTSYIFTADLACPEFGFTVAAPGLTIDLNGHTISKIGDSPNSQAIFAAAGTTIKNGTVRGFNIGIDIPEGGVRIASIKFLQNNQAIVGSSSGPNLDESRITNNTFDGAGVAGDSSGINYGFGGGSPVYVGANTFSNLSSGVGFSFWIDASIVDNTFTNSGAAISLYTVGDATISRNTISFSGIGISLGQEVERTSVIGNTVHHSQIGIQLKDLPDPRHGGDTDNVIRTNNLSNNGAAGIAVIDLFGAKNLVIDGNTTSTNGFAPAGATNDPIGTDPLNDGIYVNVVAGSTVTLTNNHANNNADHGIEAVGVTTSSGNTAFGNHGSSQCVGVTCS